MEKTSFVIMGGTGHVGAATARALLDRGETLTIVTHDAYHDEEWRKQGAEIVHADIEDVDSLRAAFRRGRRAFLLNPPADTSNDTDAIERHTISNILSALIDSGLEKVVAESTGGSQPGAHIGDLGTLWTLEEGLRNQKIPAAINRAAYYMSNWDAMLQVVRDSGKLPSLYPADFSFPMVAPVDLGRVAADRLLSDVADTGVRYVIGPMSYTPNDVARAFSNALSKPVDVAVTPADRWVESYLKLGFSDAAANSYAAMTAISIKGGFDVPSDAIRGTTTLDAYIDDLVRRSAP